MPKDNISHLPPDVQASIKAARKEAEKAEAKKVQVGSADWTNEEEDLAATSTPKARVQASGGGWTSEEEDLAAMSTPKSKAGVREDVQGAVDKKLAERAAKKKEKTYVVQPGDSLSKIAKELLGDATRWSEIFELNKDQIKDPNLIRVGQELRLP